MNSTSYYMKKSLQSEDVQMSIMEKYAPVPITVPPRAKLFPSIPIEAVQAPFTNTLETILMEAIWAPSGDNIQPWRIIPLSPTVCLMTVVYGEDTIFDLDHASTHMALGTFIETACIAAIKRGYEPLVQLESQSSDRGDVAPVYKFEIFPLAEPRHETLFEYIKQRKTNRFPYKRIQMTSEQKKLIENNIPAGYRFIWFEGSKRLRGAYLTFLAGCIRYAAPESFKTHQETIDWANATHSPDRIPAQGIGMPRIMLPFVKWFLGSKNRFWFFVRFMMGHMTTAFQLDFIPNYFCAGQVAILADKQPKTPDDFVMAGRSVQRFWLSLTAVGLVSQPLYSPLIFSRYHAMGIKFTNAPYLQRKASSLTTYFKKFLGQENDLGHVVWFARLGATSPIQSYSERVPVKNIIQ